MENGGKGDGSLFQLCKKEPSPFPKKESLPKALF
jgi:hypothetical protein